MLVTESSLMAIKPGKGRKGYAYKPVMKSVNRVKVD